MEAMGLEREEFDPATAYPEKLAPVTKVTTI